MRIVIKLEDGLIQGIVTDGPAEILILNHDAELPGIDDEPEETVIDFNGDEVICDAIEPEVNPLHIAYFFGMHEVQNELQYL